jgi:hypothetical protein
MFEFTADELAFLRDTRAIATDDKGREVLVGLTFEETETYMAHRRKFLTGRRDRADRKACIALANKHQKARLELLANEVLVRTQNPHRY